MGSKINSNIRGPISKYTKPVYRNIGYKSGIKNDDHPFVDFDIKLKLKGFDLKQCKKEIFPEIEGLFCIERTQKAGVRFANVLIANMLDAYRKDLNNPSGAELAQSKESFKSIQFMGMRKISEYTVGAVMGWLCENGYAQKVRAYKKCTLTIVDGEIKEERWRQERSTLFVATPKLMKLVSASTLGNSKICKGCGEDKNLSEYSKQRNGYEAQCKSCRAKAKKVSRAKLKKAA